MAIISDSPPFRGSPLVERFIRRLAAYGVLEEPARDALRRVIVLSPVIPPGEARPADLGPDIAILLQGWACHYRLFDNGRRQITSLVIPGDLLDFGFLTGRDTLVQYRLTAPTQFGRIRLPAFIDVTEQHPSVMRAVLQASAIEAAIRQERVISLGLRNAIERVAHLLCEVWYRLTLVDMVGPDNSFDLPMTQADIGEALGLSMVHVNRTLQTLRRGDAITIQRGRVTLHDLSSLAAMAGFDPSYIVPVSHPHYGTPASRRD